jgi:glucosamine-6-phosphate deaminase
LPIAWASTGIAPSSSTWTNTSAFHRSIPSSFRLWIKTHLADKVQPVRAHYLAADALGLDAEIKRYSELLLAAPIDLAFVGFGENGHIAFNDPPVADFNDPATVKRVALDELCRRQQAGEGHFPSLDAVAREALTLTCPGLFALWLGSAACPMHAKRKQFVMLSKA